MKRLLLAAFAVAGLVALPAAGANHQHGGGGGGRAGAAHMGGGHFGGGHMGGAHFAGSRSHASHHYAGHAHYGHHTAHHRAAYHGAHHRTTHHGARHGTTHHHAVHRSVHAARHAEHRAAVAHDRFSHVRRAMRATRRFHAGIYRAPHGWYAHHWAIGERLPRDWFVRDYWINDWAIYGLWAPIDGLIWVRVGPDAMLVDPVTGAIVAVDYALFW